MSASSAQLQFAAEFVLFLAAASGLALLALRGALLNGKVGGEFALTAGFLALGTSAFLHGSRLVDDGGSTLIVGLRTAGIAAVLAGCLWGWVAGETARVLLGVAVAFLAAATFVDAGDSSTFSRVALTLGGLAMGVAVLLASRRSIAARVAATAATTLLIVVLVLGVAISAVLVDTVQDSAVNRLERTAKNEARTAFGQSATRIQEAKIAARTLAGNTGSRNDVLAAAAAPRGSDIITQHLKLLADQGGFLPDVALAFISQNGLVHGFHNLDVPQVIELAGKPVVTEALRSGERASVELLGSPLRAYSVAVEPVELSSGRSGVAIALKGLDDSYLEVAADDDPSLSLSLIKNLTVVARRGEQPSTGSIAGMVRTALVENLPSKGVVDDRFVAVWPVRLGNDTPQLALVASSPTTLVNETRDKVFRNLFLVALGGALLALLFSVAIGARIGAGLSRLRTAAEAIQEGDFGVRAGVESSDEVGLLSRAFDSMATSVQDKTATEARLRGRLEAVVAGMGEALIALDGRNRVTDFNRAAEELIGVRQAEALGRPVDEIVRLSDEEGLSILIGPATGAGRLSTLGVVETLDGRRIPVAVSVGALRGPGAEAGGNVIVLADLTKERQVERMKKEFLSRIGHELRHPLVPLMGYAEILNRKEVAPEQARVMHSEMLDQSRKLLRHVEMLEFFAADGAGEDFLRLTEVDPRVVIDDVVRRWQHRLGAADVIRPRVRKATPWVIADKGRLTKCLDELVDNAVKFSDNGGKIVVSAEPYPDGGVEISVTDHGQGMTAAEQDKAFEEFVQGDPSDTRAHGGLGLGLAFVRRVTEAHGGTLVCRSVLGKGSKFSIVVPDVPKKTAR